MSREEVLELATSQSHEGELEADQLNFGSLDMAPGGFSDLGAADPPMEGDNSMSAPSL